MIDFLDYLDALRPNGAIVLRGRLGRRRVTLADLRRLRRARELHDEADARRRRLLRRIYGAGG